VYYYCPFAAPDKSRFEYPSTINRRPATAVHSITALAAVALSVSGFIEIGCRAAKLDPTDMAPIRFHRVPLEADYSAAKAVAQLKS
jgi:hypothetical protein